MTRRPSDWVQLLWLGLGSATIIDALVTHASMRQWVAGLILLGLIPVDSFLQRRRD